MAIAYMGPIKAIFKIHQIMDFYNNKGLLKNIDGVGTINEITKRILKVLK